MNGTSGRVEKWRVMDSNPPVIVGSDGTRRQGKMVRPGQDWTLDLRNQEMSFIRIDHQTWLQFGETAVVIGCPFILNVEGTTYELYERKDLGPLLAQYPDTLTTGTVYEDGTLNLVFGRDWAIDVPPDPHYEAWQIQGPGKNLVVCPPDGKALALWSDDGASDDRAVTDHP
jgi:hypothetical protein